LDVFVHSEPWGGEGVAPTKRGGFLTAGVKPINTAAASPWATARGGKGGAILDQGERKKGTIPITKEKIAEADWPPLGGGGGKNRRMGKDVKIEGAAGNQETKFAMWGEKGSTREIKRKKGPAKRRGKLPFGLHDSPTEGKGANVRQGEKRRLWVFMAAKWGRKQGPAPGAKRAKWLTQKRGAPGSENRKKKSLGPEGTAAAFLEEGGKKERAAGEKGEKKVSHLLTERPPSSECCVPLGEKGGRKI